jgi:hypothetical protein
MNKSTPIQIHKDAVIRMPPRHRSAAHELLPTDNHCHFCAAVYRDVFEADLGKHPGCRAGTYKNHPS